MEDRAREPACLPADNPTASYWQNPPSWLDNYSSDAPAKSNIVIVGSGISGASIAYHLLSQDPTLSVLMLEARTICNGATGRNGGHTKAASYRYFADNVARVGLEDAIKIVRLERENVKVSHEFIRENKIDCDSVESLSVDVIYDNDVWQATHGAIAGMETALGECGRYHIRDSVATEKEFHCADSCGSVQYPAGSLNAYRFTCGIIELCLDLGMKLQTNTPVTRLVKSDNWEVHTSSKVYLTDKVILATNAYTPFLLKELQGIILPLRGQMTAQRPGSKMPQRGLANTYSFVYKTGYDYMISKQAGAAHEGDICIGGELSRAKEEGLYEWGTYDDTCLNPDISVPLRASAANYFGANWGDDNLDGRIRAEWTGIMADSRDAQPFIGKVPGKEGMYISASFQGHGMAMYVSDCEPADFRCFLCGKALAAIVAGYEVDWLPKCYLISQERLDKARKTPFAEDHFGREPREIIKAKEL